MSRYRSTNASGKPFDSATVEAVWKKAQLSPEHHPFRVDAFGSLIWREAYGNVNSRFGWEIDHIKPVAKGGGDELDNLQPLQWDNNRQKGDAFVNGQGPGHLVQPRSEDLSPATTGEALITAVSRKPETPAAQVVLTRK
jgi:5-methylcytosine-specific restriction endonuclease McrA